MGRVHRGQNQRDSLNLNLNGECEGSDCVEILDVAGKNVRAKGDGYYQENQSSLNHHDQSTYELTETEQHVQGLHGSASGPL